MIKKYMLEILFSLLTILVFWIAITSMIMRFKNPEMTETELFLAIPKSAILNFNQ